MKINSNQSLAYQLMYFFMEEHKNARLYNHYKEYNGGNSIIIENDKWVQFVKYLKENVSENYKKYFEEDIDKTTELIYGLLDECADEERYTVECNQLENDNYSLEFRMTSEGYRYQYNDYMQSEDKRNLQTSKLTQKANLFLGITTIYYVTTFFFQDIDIDLRNVYSILKNKALLLPIFLIFNLCIPYLIIRLADYLNRKE